MLCAELISITPQTEFKIVEMARVSAPPSPYLNMSNTLFADPLLVDSSTTKNETKNTTREEQSRRLIKYLINHHHWSPFEMCNMTVKITTTRDISRQILRHRSFSFQEFSQRYQDIKILSEKPVFRECRKQDIKNRQNSISVDDTPEDQELKQVWYQQQVDVWNASISAYNKVIALGIAKEQARALLPEGMVKTQMYMTGSIRSWIHYLQIRTGPETQKEHRYVAQEIKKIFCNNLPIIAEALWPVSF
jgi:thymidylate synthase (FAD)